MDYTKIPTTVKHGCQIAAKVLNTQNEALIGEAYLWYDKNPMISVNNLVNKLVTYQRSKYTGAVSMPLNKPKFNTVPMDKVVLQDNTFQSAEKEVEFADSVTNLRKTLSKNQWKVLNFLWLGLRDNDIMTLCKISKQTLTQYKTMLKRKVKDAISQ